MARWRSALIFGLLVACHSGVRAEEDDEAEKEPEKDEEKSSDDAEGEVKKEDNLVDGFTAEQQAEMGQSAEKHEFQAEVNRLMDIIINSLYTDKQVFLRELISNSADALEKARFHGVQDENYLGDHKDMEIQIEFDKDAKTISIVDTGIGMTKADLINNLGTVAKSGTTNFLEAMADGGDANLIGQFGVGFYSAFLVADKIAVTSKCNDEAKQHVWTSSADASFTVVEDPRGNTLGRGSRVTLYLKEDSHEFLNEEKLKEVVTKYSQFIQFPIYVRVAKEVAVDDDDDDDDEDDEDKEEKEEKDEKSETKTVMEWEQVNTQKAIWLRNKDEVTEEEYNEFYKTISKDYLDPAAYTHFNAEGEIEFKSILFLPKKQASQMDDMYNKKSEIKLYVRRVLVADKFEELLPKYLNFVRGVVDSDDLPLNVSREQLQQNKIMKVISKKLIRKILELMKKMSRAAESGEEEEDEDEKDEDKEKEEKDEEEGEKKTDDKKDKKFSETPWGKFYNEFKRNLKMGCHDDDANRSKLSKLLRFASTKSDSEEISFDTYLDRMQENQNNIYFISGESIESMMKSPNLGVFLKKDIEVFLLTEPMDEPCMMKISDYEGKKIQSIQKADLTLEETEEEKERFTKLKEMYASFLKWYKDLLVSIVENGDLKTMNMKIENVVVSKRLTTDPVIVVTSQFGFSAQQEKMMKAQAFQSKEQVQMMSGRKTLEVNPNHPIIYDLFKKVKENKEDANAKAVAQDMFQAALLAAGYDIVDPTSLTKRMFRLMSKELGVDPEAKIEEVEIIEDEEEEADDDDDADSDDKEEKSEDEKSDDDDGEKKEEL